MIRKPNKQDANRIYEIAKENTLDAKKKHRGGFLVSNYPLETYQNYIETLEHFYVLDIENKIVGFLLAFKEENLDLSLTVNRFIKNRAKSEYLILKQICIAINDQRKGYATLLYQHFMDTIDIDIFLAVVLKPYNEPSMKFHEKLGFNLVWELIAEDSKPRGIFYWNNPVSTRYFNKDLLVKQYALASELYRHEDSLNWTKLNYLFYVSASLIAGIVIASNLPTENAIKYALIITSSIGIITSILFIFAIFSGVNYMQIRKKAYMKIERLLENMGGASLINVLGEKKKVFLKAPTEYVLKGLPIIITVMWVILLLVGTFYM